jgi:hypothetical protein
VMLWQRNCPPSTRPAPPAFCHRHGGRRQEAISSAARRLRQVRRLHCDSVPVSRRPGLAHPSPLLAAGGHYAVIPRRRDPDCEHAMRTPASGPISPHDRASVQHAERRGGCTDQPLSERHARRLLPTGFPPYRRLGARLSESFRAVGIPAHGRSGRRLGRMFMHSPRLARTRASAAFRASTAVGCAGVMVAARGSARARLSARRRLPGEEFLELNQVFVLSRPDEGEDQPAGGYCPVYDDGCILALDFTARYVLSVVGSSRGSPREPARGSVQELRWNALAMRAGQMGGWRDAVAGQSGVGVGGCRCAGGWSGGSRVLGGRGLGCGGWGGCRCGGAAAGGVDQAADGG